MVQAMHSQVRRLSSGILLNAPPLDYEKLQALLLLGMWSAAGQVSISIDSWLLSGIALNHAILSFDFLEEEGSPDFSTEALRERRVWNGLCLTRLQ